jgi:hypothetical protein
MIDLKLRCIKNVFISFLFHNCYSFPPFVLFPYLGDFIKYWVYDCIKEEEKQNKRKKEVSLTCIANDSCTSPLMYTKVMYK